MKKLLSCLSFTVVLSLQYAYAQQTPVFNHLTVYVVDLQKSSDFYENVIMLQKIDEPFKDNRHTWFKISEHGQLHVVGGAKEIMAHDINVHLSFSVSSLPDFMKHLDSLQIKYGNWAQTSKTPQLRPDGIYQIYFQDPDGYWIEVNDDNK